MSGIQDKNELINMYLERDNNLKLNPSDQILSYLQKLGYYNINVDNELDNIISFRYKTNLDNLKNTSFNEYKNSFLETDEYNKMKLNIYEKINRSMILSKFIGTSLVKDFYNKCNYDELVYLGY